MTLLKHRGDCTGSRTFTCTTLSNFSSYFWTSITSIKSTYLIMNNWHLRLPYRRSWIAPRSVRFGVRSRKLRNVGRSLNGYPKMSYLELLRASEGTLSHWSRLHLQSLAPSKPHWARVVGYGPFSLCIIHKEGLCPRSGDINGLMMMMIANLSYCSYIKSNKLFPHLLKVLKNI
jgi:hypothetical protein